jgi:hypothetical protein
MQRRIRLVLSLFLAVVLSLVLSAAPARAGLVVADLGADWSDTSNPNAGAFGTWSYRQGTSLLPHFADNPLLGIPATQPTWAPSTALGHYIPAIFKATSDQTGTIITGPVDWLVGDIIVHTTDPFNGIGNGPANTLWTSPVDGTLTISGFVFEARVTTGVEPRNSSWSLLVNDSLVTSGTLLAGDGHDRSNPVPFSAGSGGADALVQTVTAGSTVELRLEKLATSPPGDFVGVSLRLDVETDAATAVPEPSSLVLALVGGAGVLGWRWRRRNP